MPSVAVTKSVFSGTLPGGEVWSAGCYTRPIDPGTSMQSAAEASVAASNFTALVTALKALNNAGTFITAYTMYRYPAGSDVATDVGRAPITGGGGTGPSVHPNQVAFVTTLRTALATRRGRGRMYWPATGVEVVAATGLANQTPLAAFVAALATWGGGEDIKVYSKTGNLVTDVIRIDADAVLDQQTNRRDRLRPPRFGNVVA